MPQNPAAALSLLLRGASIDDHEEVLKAASLAIKADKSDILARHTKLVALLKLDRFDDAARFLAESGSALESKCVIEKAYALYKSGELEEATATLKKAGLRERSLQHIAAQVAYRAERFGEAGQIYEELLEGNPGDEENDLNINLKAVHAQAEWSGLSAPSEPFRSMPDSFELCYNIACASIARGELGEASKLLQRAAMLCKGSDELGEEDKEAELRPIWLQQAYVYAREGKLKEALGLYSSIGSLRYDNWLLTLCLVHLLTLYLATMMKTLSLLPDRTASRLKRSPRTRTFYIGKWLLEASRQKMPSFSATSQVASVRIHICSTWMCIKQVVFRERHTGFFNSQNSRQTAPLSTLWPS